MLVFPCSANQKRYQPRRVRDRPSPEEINTPEEDGQEVSTLVQDSQVMTSEEQGSGSPAATLNAEDKVATNGTLKEPPVEVMLQSSSM